MIAKAQKSLKKNYFLKPILDALTVLIIEDEFGPQFTPLCSAIQGNVQIVFAELLELMKTTATES